MPSLSPSETWNWSTNDKRGRVPPSHLNSNGIIRTVTVQYWHKNQWKYLSNLGSGVVLLVRYLALASLSCYPQTDKESLSQGPARDLCWLRRACWQQAPVYVSPAQNNVQWCYKLNLYKIRTSIMFCKQILCLLLVNIHTLWQRTTVHILPWYYHQFVGTFQNNTTYIVTDLHMENSSKYNYWLLSEKGKLLIFPIFTRGSNKFHPKILMRGSPLLHLWKALIQLYINTTHNWFLFSLAITSV